MATGDPHSSLAEVAKQIAAESRARTRRTALTAGVAIVILAAAIGYALAQIQSSRHDNCVAQNQHHDRALNYLDKLNPAKAAEFRILIQDIAPYQDCTKKVR